MAFKPTAPTHYCQSCGQALWANTWAYALCKPCGHKPCKHGAKHGHCDHCDTESDQAYDAKR